VHLVTDQTAEDGRAGMAMEIDPALDVLAIAETGSAELFGEVLHAAHPVTSSGGLVFAVLTDLDEDLARRVASLRQPGGTALAVVLDPHGFRTGRRAATHRDDAEGELACISVLRAAGWTVAVVGTQDQVASVWAAMSGTTSMAGAP
jgi:hypothetical protein